MIPRLQVGKGVTGAVQYVLGQGRDAKTLELKPAALTEDQSRVDWIGGQNFGFAVHDRETADLARRVMEFDALNQASRTRKCEQDCIHLSLGWKPGESVSRQQMEDAARDALKALGMENAKALFVAHRDEEHAHVHIVASKINPATGRAYDLAGSYRTLSAWAQDYELAHSGILCARREGANALRKAIADRDADAVLTELTRQRATFTGAQLHRALEKEIIGPARGKARAEAEKELARFHADVLARPQLVELVEDRNTGRVEDKARRFTTTAVLDAEQQVVVAVNDLAGNFSHGVSDAARAKVASGKTMSDEQAAAFIHATLPGGFALIDGQAGTGKSYTIAAVREAYEDTGRRVIGLAPTNAVAQDMRADGFQHAATIHSEIFALNNGRRQWDAQTVVIVDEAAMLDTKLLAMVTAHAADAGAKLILVGDDRQLSSIDHGGMFAVLKDRHGAAELAEVKRQHKNDERRASEMFASGNFHDALNIYDRKGAIHWTRTQGEARAELIDQWRADSAAAPEKTRFVFAYTNADVDALNAALRGVRKERGELGEDRELSTATGRKAFAAGDRIQFAATEKKLGIVNGAAGTVESIDGGSVTVMLDGRQPKRITFDAGQFNAFRHGYAGTIYKGQGRTLDQTYLYHSEAWRSTSSYVAMTRHRDKAELFVARNTAKDVKQLARQMGRTDDRRAASMFEIKARQEQQTAEAPRRLAALELLALIAPRDEHAEARRSNTVEPPPATPATAEPPRAVHRGERQAGHYDEMDAAHRAAQPDPAPRRYDPLRESFPAEIVRTFDAAANRTTEPPSPVFDRDAANADWQAKMDAAGIEHAAKPEPVKKIEARAPVSDDATAAVAASEITPAPADTGGGAFTPAEPSTGPAAPPVAEESKWARIDAARAEWDAQHATGRAAGKIIDVFGKAAEAVTGLLTSIFMGGPKLTRQQAKDAEKARTNLETADARAYAAHVAASEAEHDERMHVAKTAQQEKDLRLSQTQGGNATAEAQLNATGDEEQTRQRKRGLSL